MGEVRVGEGVCGCVGVWVCDCGGVVVWLRLDGNGVSSGDSS